MLSVFGDESADETSSRTFAVAGIVGTEPQWIAAEERWLECTGGEVFHAADCEHHGGLSLYKDLTTVLVDSDLGAYGVAIDLAAVEDLLPDLPPRREIFEVLYGCCELFGDRGCGAASGIGSVHV